jgi:hypothetical protein
MRGGGRLAAREAGPCSCVVVSIAVCCAMCEVGELEER